MEIYKVEPAKQYGVMITRKGKIISAVRVRLFDGHMYNWSHTIIWNDKISVPTDQTFDLEANYMYDLDFYDEVWFEGVLLYKKSWYKRIWRAISK